METKKSIRASLEKGKSFSFMMGAVVALSVLFTAFEWGDMNYEIDTSNRINMLPPEGVITIDPTRQDFPEPPKPEEIIKAPDIITIIDDAQKVEVAKIAPSEGFINEPQPMYTSPIEEPKEVIEEPMFVGAVEEKPEFPGGENAFLRWIAESVKYPAAAAENGIEGLVSCTFIINTDGSISNISVYRSIDPLLDKEAIRVLQSMPKWKPGMQQGKAVRVKFSVPVRFRLQK